jgi:hypothetical protein
MLVLTLALSGAEVGASGGSERLTVVKTRKLVVNLGQSAVIQGRWKLIGRRDPDFSLARVNSSFIQCSRFTKTCEETVAELRTPDDGKRLGIESGELLATCHTYEVTEWTDTKLVAISRKAVADLVIRVDFKVASAERVFREHEDLSQFSNYTLE